MTRTGGRLMQTPEIEPLTMARGPQAEVVDLIHRPASACHREAMRWKVRKAHRPEGYDGGLDEPHLPADVGIGHAALAGLETSASATATRPIIARTRPVWTIADLASLALGAVTCRSTLSRRRARRPS